MSNGVPHTHEPPVRVPNGEAAPAHNQGSASGVAIGWMRYVASTDETFIRQSLTPAELKDLAQVVDAVNSGDGCGFVLVVGSVARLQRTATSDVDVLVAAERPPAIHTAHIDVFPNHVTTFVDLLNEGRPMAFAALCDGKVAHDGTPSQVRALVRHKSLKPTVPAGVENAASPIRRAQHGGPDAESARLAAKAVVVALLLIHGIEGDAGPGLEALLRASKEEELAAVVTATRSALSTAEVPWLLMVLEASLHRGQGERR